MLQNIPYELQTYNQWIGWKFVKTDNGKLTKVPYQLLNPRKQASVTNSSTWAPFSCINDELLKRLDGIGFVLTESDPFGFIDLDHTTDGDIIRQQQNIFAQFSDTYAEFSPSGKGLHIIVKGQLPSGRKRGKIEMYSNLRFMTMTGNVYNNKFITDCQQRFINLYETLGKTERSYEIANQDQKLSDYEVYQQAANAANGEKFVDLFHGNWQKWYAPPKSQSEADFALIDMISFYSRNVEQIKRIFRTSALGKRQKAEREDYINRAVSRSFDNYMPPIDIGAMIENLKIAKAQAEQVRNKPKRKPLNLKLLPMAQLYPDRVSEINEPVPDISNIRLDYDPYAQTVEFEDLPDGYIKEIARFIYAQSPRPVKTIAKLAALGLMSGICGRAYNVSGTGLNNYFVLLGLTGIGKEAMARGIDKLINNIATQQPMAHSFVGLGELVSGVSLIRYLAEESQCFLTIQGEFGLTMSQMTNRNATAPKMQLRKVLLDLYNKSGKGDILRSTVYSDKTKNIKEVMAPAFSMLCESTPSTFYDSLTDSLVEEGLISRLNIVEASPRRPPFNENHMNVEVPSQLQSFLLNLVTNCLTLNQTNQVINVQQETEATEVLRKYNEFCDYKMNSSFDEGYRQLWNRGHLKVMKLASLFAVSRNMYQPIITAQDMHFAITFINESTNLIVERYRNREIGTEAVGENKRLCDTADIILDALNNMDKVTDNPIIRSDFVIPHTYLLRRLSQRKSYKDPRQSPAQILKQITQILVDEGAISEIRQHQARNRYGCSTKLWAISDASFFFNRKYANI